MATAASGIPRWLGVALMLGISTTFASNHVSARLAFDHGANVLTAVTFRSIGTASVVFLLMRISGVKLALPGAKPWQALLFGLAIAAQSGFLYGAVARLPVALALLTFNTFPMMLALLTWITGGALPVRRVLIAMPIALVGLALALGVTRGVEQVYDARFIEGVACALGASVTFACSWVLMTRWLSKVDGRMRSFISMSVVSILALSIGFATDGFALPRDSAGWTGLALLTVLYGISITGLFVVLPKLGAVNNAALMNFEPVAALMLGWLILEQTIAPVQMIGMVVVIGAIVMVATAKH